MPETALNKVTQDWFMQTLAVNTVGPGLCGFWLRDARILIL
jgi:hypothetical protein